MSSLSGMPTYSILRQLNPQPSDIPLFCQPGFLFNEGDHLRQQSHEPFYLLTAVNQITRQAEARCAFVVRPEGAISPIAAPFGSVEFTDTLPDSVLDELIQTLIDDVRSLGAPLLRLVNYPHCYAPEQAGRLTSRLLEQRFRVVSTDQTAFLPVSDEPFTNRIDRCERRRLRKCHEASFRFEHWSSPDVNTVVSFIQTTRQQHGYRLTISPERLTDLLLTFPDRFPVFRVKDGHVTAAMVIAVRVRDDILYTFLPASHADYRAYSPMVMLTDGLFTYCQQERIRLLDLGVSLDGNRQPKPSLMRFKQNLGALYSPKMVFEKAL